MRYTLASTITSIIKAQKSDIFGGKQPTIFLILNTKTNYVMASIIPEEYLEHPYLFVRFVNVGTLQDNIEHYQEHFETMIAYDERMSMVMDDKACYC